MNENIKKSKLNFGTRIVNLFKKKPATVGIEVKLSDLIVDNQYNLGFGERLEVGDKMGIMAFFDFKCENKCQQKALNREYGNEKLLPYLTKHKSIYIFPFKNMKCVGKREYEHHIHYDAWSKDNNGDVSSISFMYGEWFNLNFPLKRFIEHDGMTLRVGDLVVSGRYDANARKLVTERIANEFINKNWHGSVYESLTLAKVLRNDPALENNVFASNIIKKSAKVLEKSSDTRSL